MKSEENEIITTKLVMTMVILAIVKIVILILLFQDLGTLEPMTNRENNDQNQGNDDT